VLLIATFVIVAINYTFPSCKSSVRFNSYPCFLHGMICHRTELIKSSLTNFKLSLTPKQLEMWANVQRDGRPTECRWRRLSV